MKVFWLVFGALLGGGLGALAGSVGVYYACVFYDAVSYPEGVPAGGGMVAVGWLFCFLTLPLGLVAGGWLGYRFARRWQRRGQAGG